MLDQNQAALANLLIDNAVACITTQRQPTPQRPERCFADGKTPGYDRSPVRYIDAIVHLHLSTEIDEQYQELCEHVIDRVKALTELPNPPFTMEEYNERFNTHLDA